MTPLYIHGVETQKLRANLAPLIGKTIEIFDQSACIDSNIGYGTNGMRARIVSAIVFLETDPRSTTYAEPRVILELDYADFEEHNASFEESGWCDHQGNGNFTCKSLGLYTSRDVCSVDPYNPTAGLLLLT